MHLLILTTLLFIKKVKTNDKLKAMEKIFHLSTIPHFYFEIRPHISKRGYVYPSIRWSVRRSVTHELLKNRIFRRKKNIPLNVKDNFETNTSPDRQNVSDVLIPLGRLFD